MLFVIFDNCLSEEGQYPDNRVYRVLIGGVVCYLILIIIIKNIIYYEKMSENVYWLLLIVIILDLTFFINSNRNFIDNKIKHCVSKFNFLTKKKKNNNINSTNNPDLEKGLMEEDLNKTNGIIDSKKEEEEYTSVIV